MRSLVFSLGLAVLVAVGGNAPAFAAILISAQEAALPPMQNLPLEPRGITLGPSIELVSPSSDAGARSPLEFKVKFIPRNKTTIDPANVRVTYLKATPVDLTLRLKPYTTGDGIDMRDAEAPPGIHLLRIDLWDSNGKRTTSFLKLVVIGQ